MSLAPPAPIAVRRVVGGELHSVFQERVAISSVRSGRWHHSFGTHLSTNMLNNECIGSSRNFRCFFFRTLLKDVALTPE